MSDYSNTFYSRLFIWHIKIILTSTKKKTSENVHQNIVIEKLYIHPLIFLGPYWVPSRSSPPELFSWKGVLKICSKFTEHPCRSVFSKKLLCNFIEITLQYGCSSVNLLHIFRKPFYKNNSGGLLLPFNVFSFNIFSLDVKDVRSLM